MKVSKSKTVNFIGFFLKKYFQDNLYKIFLFLRCRKKFKKNISNVPNYEKFSKNLNNINKHEYKITSQNNEDGLIEFIFNNINSNKFFFEIGFDFYEFNSLNLIKNGWSGILCDANIDNCYALDSLLKYYNLGKKVKIINSKIFPDNINLIIKKFLPKDNLIDFFSLDIDGNDYWVLEKLDTSNINVICCEYNHWLGKEKKIAIPYNKNYNFLDDGYYGASFKAFYELLKSRNFELIAVDSSGTNLFFVKKTLTINFEILYPENSFQSVGRFYSEKQKLKIYENIKLKKFIELD